MPCLNNACTRYIYYPRKARAEGAWGALSPLATHFANRLALPAPLGTGLPSWWAHRRGILSEVVCNLQVEDSHIASYRYGDPFGVLEMDSSGAFKHQWWAILDELRTA